MLTLTLHPAFYSAEERQTPSALSAQELVDFQHYKGCWDVNIIFCCRADLPHDAFSSEFTHHSGHM